jgi:hypothetical protein
MSQVDEREIDIQNGIIFLRACLRGIGAPA